MQDNTDTVWKNTLETIKVSLSPANYSTWFSQTHIVDIKNDKSRTTIVIGCPSSFIKNTIETRYFGLIQDSLSSILSKECDLIFVVKEILRKKTGNDTVPPLFTQLNTGGDNIYLNRLKETRLRSSYTFENYAVSSTNQMAWAAADAIAKTPGSAYNPLFIWGGVGVGKSHLMNAVGIEILKSGDDKKVLFCTGEGFTNDIVEGIRNKSTQKVRDKYRKLDALLIDDVQFIAGKDAVQEEFFHTFNALVENGSQVILTSDKQPSEISKLEERLKSRFEAGLIVDIGNPDFELRCAIIQIKSKEKGLSLSMDLVQLIAGNIDTARKIEGFLIRLISESRFKHNNELNLESIKSILNKGEDDKTLTKASPAELINAVCDYYTLSKKSILGKSRAQSVALPRQVLMYLLRTQLGIPLVEVGHVVGDRDHTTVMHAVDKITSLASNNVQIREDITGIKNKL